jgi:hypothetical protein
MNMSGAFQVGGILIDKNNIKNAIGRMHTGQ